MDNLIMETIGSLREYLPKMSAGCQQTAESFQRGEEASALQMLPPIADGLGWLIQVVEGLQKLEHVPDLDTKAMSNIFSEMVSALEIKDYILLADLLEYEIVPVLEEWVEKLNNIH